MPANLHLLRSIPGRLAAAVLVACLLGAGLLLSVTARPAAAATPEPREVSVTCREQIGGGRHHPVPPRVAVLGNSRTTPKRKARNDDDRDGDPRETLPVAERRPPRVTPPRPRFRPLASPTATPIRGPSPRWAVTPRRVARFSVAAAYAGGHPAFPDVDGEPTRARLQIHDAAFAYVRAGVVWFRIPFASVTELDVDPPPRPGLRSMLVIRFLHEGEPASVELRSRGVTDAEQFVRLIDVVYRLRDSAASLRSG